jgi:hypothetical protein
MDTLTNKHHHHKHSRNTGGTLSLADSVGTAMRNFKTQNRGMQKGKLPFLVKIVYMNALVEVAKIIRMHGLYPVPHNDIDK